MSEVTFSVYDQTTGEIYRVVSCPDDAVALNIGTGEASLTGTWPDDEFYVDIATGTAQAKETMDPGVTTATGEATITGLPVPCEIIAERVPHTIDDGTAVLSFDAPGTYTLTITAEPIYYRHTLEVEIP